jgi:photosystem II stability/assembly factor-like uncharacterized protein
MNVDGGGAIMQTNIKRSAAFLLLLAMMFSIISFFSCSKTDGVASTDGCTIYSDSQVISIAVKKSRSDDDNQNCGTVIHTSTDHGKTWQSAEVSEFWHLIDHSAFFSFTSAQNGWYAFTYASVMHSGVSQIYKTTDGGASWQLAGTDSLYAGFIGAMGALDKDTCFISYFSPEVAGPVHPVVNATFDGGAAWETITLELPSEYSDYFSVGLSPEYDADNNLLYPVNLLGSEAYPHCAANEYTDGTVYFKSTDGGHTWVFMAIEILEA